MAGIDDKREQEHKQRVKKLKAKTSKMRLAVVKKGKKYKSLAEKDTEQHGEGLHKMMDRSGEFNKKKSNQKKEASAETGGDY